MADEVAPLAPVTAAPAAVTPVANSPILETQPSSVAPPATLEGAAPASSPAVESTPAKTDGLLGAAPVDAVKPAEAEKPAAELPKTDAPVEAVTPKEEVSQSVEPAPLPTYEPFTLPEGFTADTEKLGEFTKELAEFEASSKADHASTQALGQKLMDRHIAEVKDALDRQVKLFTDIWDKKKNDWKEAFIKDPELGGNRMETTINAGRNIIQNYGGTPEQQQELRTALIESGLEGHPGLIRLLNNVAKSPLVQEGKPLPATKPVVPQGKKSAKWYGGSAT